MKYQHSKEESAEYLRRALPLMANQEAPLHPVSYAVWYEYVSGINTALIDAIDTLLAQHTTLSERAIFQLFERYVADINSETANTIAAGFQRILGEVSQSTGVAAKEAGVFGETLQRLALDSGKQNAPVDLEVLLAGTQAMQASVATLKSKLDTSQQEIDTLRKEVARARDASLTDGLTGLVNRRGFDQALTDCLASAGAKGGAEGPCLLMGDIDHFKKINDTYGHLFGDKVIRAVATVIKDNVKGRDTAARYGGEEFVVLLPDTSLNGAQVLAEQIRSAIERGRIKRSGSDEAMARVTLSLGVTRYQPGEPHTAFIERADRALYASKQNGRNRVSVAAAG
jgi:diguanylate cyclase